ncbi:uncharacterized protein LOC133873305 [Alnus glutinosa]|uniref:uncharacterized protein LOC133873305 n=1 Tax=Alnus glutinosa TaxID=3517 RepID=UPI002D78FD6D|nr:uncharacterized protein LOC133873305 [Alnus glutinosa]
MGAKEVLENGVGCRIGNGKQVKIWGDAWLQPPHTRLFLPPNHVLSPDSHVDALIDSEVGWWNLNLLQNCFSQEEVERIGNVIISPLGQDDKIIWKGTPSGLFTVKSAYHMEMWRISRERGESSGEYGGGMECSRRIQKLTYEETDGRGLLLFFFEKLDNEEVLEALTVAQMIWLRRNSMVFGRGFSPPLKVISEVHSSLEDGALGSSNLAHFISGLEVGHSFWSKPPQGWWKINWDASIDKEARRMGIRAVIRDGNGAVVAARMSFLPYNDDPSAVEALAAWHAVKLGREMGGTCIIIEGDSMEVVMALRKNRYNYQNYGHLLEDIATSLSFFSICSSSACKA